MNNAGDPSVIRQNPLRPFLGIIFGVFAFLFIAGGLMTLSGAPPDSSLFTTKTVMFYCAVAFLTGYAGKASQYS